MQKIIEELKLADATLDADGYKTWSSVRLAIAQAMDLLQKQLLQQTNCSALLPPSDEDIIRFSNEAITMNGAVELTDDRRLMAKLVQKGAEWMRWKLTGRQ